MPDSRIKQPASSRALRHRRRIVTGGIAGLTLLAVGGGVAVATSGNSGPKYRLADVTTATVNQALTSVGTLSPVNQATASFPIAGTVSAVNVHVGDKVTAGQTIATLSTTALQQQVTSDAAAVAVDQQTLATDEASQTASTTSSATTGTATAATSAQTTKATSATNASISTGSTTMTATGKTTTAPGHSSGTSHLVAAVTRDQKALVTAQRTLDSDLNLDEQALQTCQNALEPSTAPTSTLEPSTTPTSTPTTSAATSAAPGTPIPTSSSAAPDSPSSSAPSSPPADATATCLTAIAAAPSRSQASADQRTLISAETALTRAIAKLATAAESNPATTAGSTSATKSGTTSTSGNRSTSKTTTTTGTKSTGTSGGVSGSTSGSRATASGPATAQQLAADQAEIDAANANLVAARQNVGGATLTSPISGTVAAVSLAAGSAVSASSTSADIMVIGPGQTEVATTVPLTSIESVKVGQHASVSVDGVPTPVTGKVTSIGALSTTTGTTTSYPVTILLDPTSTKLVDGAGATVSIAIASVSNVLTVPSTAVHLAGSAGIVTVLANGKATLTRVTVGAVGVDRTQILTGLTAGEKVVLATLNAPLPTSTTNNGITRRLGVTTTGGGALSGSGLGGTTRTGG